MVHLVYSLYYSIIRLLSFSYQLPTIYVCVIFYGGWLIVIRTINNELIRWKNKYEYSE